jgi:hypothetical protein
LVYALRCQAGVPGDVGGPHSLLERTLHQLPAWLRRRVIGGTCLFDLEPVLSMPEASR